MAWYREWKPYVPVAKRRAQAASFAARLAKKEKRELCPVTASGRTIASTVWGQAWCANLERYSDFENRLPRGRTYLRNGSIIDLQVSRGEVRAMVSGSEIYHVAIAIRTLRRSTWQRIARQCASSIGSLIDLLQGHFDRSVMQHLARPKDGLFPQPSEIEMECSCPDWAAMCKHVAAALYGVGTRLDASPELLFTLRGVDHRELVNQATDSEHLDRSLPGSGTLADADLGELFGIALDMPDNVKGGRPAARRRLARGEASTPKVRRPLATDKPLARVKKPAKTANSGVHPGTKAINKPRRPAGKPRKPVGASKGSSVVQR